MSTQIALTLLAIPTVLLPASWQIRFNAEPGRRNVVATSADAEEAVSDDPAEQKAVARIKKHEGLVTRDRSQPGHPVVEVRIFRPFDDADVPLLAAFDKLRMVHISNAGITGRGLKALADCPDLVELDVSQNPISDEGVKEIATLTQLKILRIRGVKAREQSIKELSALENLEELALANSFNMGNLAARHVAKGLPQLERLYFDNSDIGDVGVMALAKMPKLKFLTLFGTDVTDEGLEALAKSESLEELRLNHSDVTDASAKILARFKKLERLSLFSTQLTDRGLMELGKSRTLQSIDVSGSRRVSNAGVAAFMDAHPDVSVSQ